MSRWPSLALPVLLLVSACSGGGGGEITVDIEVTGDGVDQASIELRGGTRMVDLPWHITFTVEDGAGTDAFTVIATNPTDAGELTCHADWRQASTDGTWSRTASYQVSCGARVNFQDNGIVRLTPTGRRVTFEELEEQLAQEAAERAAELERQAQVDAARSSAVAALEMVRVGDWDITASGVLRDAEAYIEDLSATTIRGRGVPIVVELTATNQGAGSADPSDLSFVLIGGFDLERFKTFEVSCGAIPDPAYDAGEAATGETVVFNVCWQVDKEQTAEAFVEVDQFGVGVEAEPVQLLLPEVEGLAGNLSGAATGVVAVGEQWLVEVVDVRVDDLEGLRVLTPDMDGPRNGRAFLSIEVRVTNVGEFASWPSDGHTDWFIAAADGVTRYDDVADGCPRYTSPLTDRDIGDPLFEPGDTLVLDHCWELAAEHVDGSKLMILGIGGEALLDLGL